MLSVAICAASVLVTLQQKPSINYVPVTTSDIRALLPKELQIDVPIADPSKHPVAQINAALNPILNSNFRMAFQDAMYVKIPQPAGNPQYRYKTETDARPSGKDLESARTLLRANPKVGSELIRIGKLPLKDEQLPNIALPPMEFVTDFLLLKAAVDADDHKAKAAQDDLFALIQLSYDVSRSLYASSDLYGVSMVMPYLIRDAFPNVRLALAWKLVDAKATKSLLARLAPVPTKDWWAIDLINIDAKGRTTSFLTSAASSDSVWHQYRLNGNLDGPETARLLPSIVREAIDAAVVPNNHKSSWVERSIQSSHRELFPLADQQFFGSLVSQTDEIRVQRAKQGDKFQQAMTSTPNSIGLTFLVSYGDSLQRIVAISGQAWKDWAAMRDLLQKGS